MILRWLPQSGESTNKEDDWNKGGVFFSINSKWLRSEWESYLFMNTDYVFALV